MLFSRIVWQKAACHSSVLWPISPMYLSLIHIYDSCVAFPALTCLAATWNPEMSLLYGQSIGEEARYRNQSVLLGPGVNIYRTPLNGRNFEYMGEDLSLIHIYW